MNIINKLLPNTQLKKFSDKVIELGSDYEGFGGEIYDLFYDVVYSFKDIRNGHVSQTLKVFTENKEYIISKTDKSVYYLLCAFSCYYIKTLDIDISVQSELSKVITFLKLENGLHTKLLLPYIYKTNKTYDDRMFMFEKIESEKCLELLTSPESKNKEIEYNYDLLKLDVSVAVFEDIIPKQLIDEYTYETKKLEITRDRDLLVYPLSSESINYNYAKDLLLVELEHGKITKDQFEKANSTLDKKVWYKFKVNVDIENNDPSSWEFDIDYNEFFVEWLRNNGYELDENSINTLKEESQNPDFEFDSLDDAIEHYVVEFWFKNNMTKIVAGFLRSDERNTFRPAVVGEPSATIVEELQIDEDKINSADEGFKEFLDKIKNRKSYR